MAKYVTKSYTLTELDLSWNGLAAGKGTAALAEALKQPSCVVRRHWPACCKATPHLAPCIAQSSQPRRRPAARPLPARWHSPEAVPHCCARPPARAHAELRCAVLSLRRWLQVARLQLAHNRLGAGGVMQLAATLGANPRLAYVGLSANHIGEDGAFVLGANLLYNDRLQELDVRHPLPLITVPESPLP